MAELRRQFESLGFTGVATFIASGNVLFDAALRRPEALETRIAAHLEKALGYPVGTFIRTPAEMAAVSAYRPFPPALLDTPGSALYVMFLAAPLAAASARALTALQTPVDEFHLCGREAYWYARAKLTQSQVNQTQLAKAIGVPLTMRNITTVRKLAALLAPDARRP
jgi:uncharacterized protein (DUF1697 family)